VKHAISCILVLLVVVSTSHAQDRPSRLEIKDGAAMFRKATADILERSAGGSGGIGTVPLPVTIETIDQLSGQSIEEATRQRLEKSASAGMYILISRRDHKIDVAVSKSDAALVPEPLREQIQQTFIAGLRGGDFDRALMQGVMFIRSTLQNAKFATNAAEWTGRATTTGSDASSALVLRNQARLTLAGAQRILEGAQKKAVEMNLKMNIAVVDDGGHMIAFQRMDGARPASGYTATTKAVTAATFRAPSGPIPPGTTAPDPLLNLSLQNAALASGGKITTLQGGIPVMVDGQVIGGVGVGGGTGEQDATVARAGVEALEAALKASAEAPKEAPPSEK
jgi:glc operon protein GlcG